MTKKPCTQSIMQKYLQQRKTVGEAAAADEEEEEQEQEEQKDDTEDSGGESGGDKCMVCGEREEDDVDIEDWVHGFIQDFQFGVGWGGGGGRCCVCVNWDGRVIFPGHAQKWC